MVTPCITKTLSSFPKKDIQSWLVNLPRQGTPLGNMTLLRAYQPLISINKALLNPYFWRGIGWLDHMESQRFRTRKPGHLFQLQPVRRKGASIIAKFQPLAPPKKNNNPWVCWQRKDVSNLCLLFPIIQNGNLVPGPLRRAPGLF